MNPVFSRATAMLKSRRAGSGVPHGPEGPTGTGFGKMGQGAGSGPMTVASAPSGGGGGLLDRMRARVRGQSGTAGGGMNRQGKRDPGRGPMG